MFIMLGEHCHVMFPKYDVFRIILHLLSCKIQQQTTEKRRKKVWVYLSCCQIGSEMLNTQPRLLHWYSFGVLLSKLHEINDACLWTNELVFLWAPAGLWGGCHSVTSRGRTLPDMMKGSLKEQSHDLHHLGAYNPKKERGPLLKTLDNANTGNI